MVAGLGIGGVVFGQEHHGGMVRSQGYDVGHRFCAVIAGCSTAGVNEADQTPVTGLRIVARFKPLIKSLLRLAAPSQTG